MASYRSIRNALLAVVLLGIPVLLLRSAAQDPQGLSGFDRTVRSIGAPLEAGVSYAAGSVGRFFERWVLQARLQEDNEKLEADNRKLRLELRALLAVEDENKELRRSLQMREKVPEDMIAAEISGVEQSPYFGVVKLQIDRGAAFVRTGMAVIADAGVVGRIDRADPRRRIAAQIIGLDVVKTDPLMARNSVNHSGYSGILRSLYVGTNVGGDMLIPHQAPVANLLAKAEAFNAALQDAKAWESSHAKP